jgi:hypothetical protein
LRVGRPVENRPSRGTSGNHGGESRRSGLPLAKLTARQNIGQAHWHSGREATARRVPPPTEPPLLLCVADVAWCFMDASSEHKHKSAQVARHVCRGAPARAHRHQRTPRPTAPTCHVVRRGNGGAWAVWLRPAMQGPVGQGGPGGERRRRGVELDWRLRRALPCLQLRRGDASFKLRGDVSFKSPTEAQSRNQRGRTGPSSTASASAVLLHRGALPEENGRGQPRPLLRGPFSAEDSDGRPAAWRTVKCPCGAVRFSAWATTTLPPPRGQENSLRPRAPAPNPG